MLPKIRRALISVSDKRGLTKFAGGLESLGVEILSTGGTLAALQAAGIRARSVSEVTEFPEILGGRLKTLHPKIHGAILAINGDKEHARDLERHGIEPIDLVVVNLYPFESTVSRKGTALEEAIEQIDIGGPAMIRAAAKNFRCRAVVVNPDTYDSLLEEMKSHDGSLTAETCIRLAREAFHLTARYDNGIAQYLNGAAEDEPFPEELHIVARRSRSLRYGENPHQRAALYGSVEQFFTTLHGKELSYNNIADLAAASLLIAEFSEPTVVIVKHTNPCGVGSATTLADAYAKAFATDTKSPFGGIVAVNRPLDRNAAERINEIFTEVVIAPDYPEEVLDLLRKKKDRRIIRQNRDLRTFATLDLRSVPGGYLIQESDSICEGAEHLHVVTKRHPTDREMRAMQFAWRVAKHVKSNAIVYALEDRTMGIGAGQMSRVDAARIAAMKAADAGLNLQETAVGSDAFFPFADGLLEVVRAGATAVIQPGGSVRDNEVIRAADEHNVTMVCTGIRHFRH